VTSSPKGIAVLAAATRASQIFAVPISLCFEMIFTFGTGVLNPPVCSEATGILNCLLEPLKVFSKADTYVPSGLSAKSNACCARARSNNGLAAFLADAPGDPVFDLPVASVTDGDCCRPTEPLFGTGVPGVPDVPGFLCFCLDAMI
jgi:hypothetical protein